MLLYGKFQSTLSMRRATQQVEQFLAPLTFQSTLSMRRATRADHVHVKQFGISIHALHEESDRSRRREGLIVVISIHALHEESDLGSVGIDIVACLFQSTLSMRRATLRQTTASRSRQFQSTLSMRRATIARADHTSPHWHFNPRSP